MSRSKLPISKARPPVIVRFTSDLRDLIERLRSELKSVFHDFRTGRCGKAVQKITLKLFRRWLEIQLLPGVEDTAQFLTHLVRKYKDVAVATNEAIRGLEPLRIEDEKVRQVIRDLFVVKRKGGAVKSKAYQFTWKIYDRYVGLFCIQSAHIIVGRLLMYYVGVDKGAWKPITFKVPIRRHLDFYWTVRKQFSELLPAIYHLNELDWIYIPDTVRQALSRQEVQVLNDIEDRLDRLIANVIYILSGYNYSNVDTDVWKMVYQRFLPKDEIRRLGFVPTPDEIVSLILDLVGYKEDVEELCEKTILDPAYGSGTFLVEALIRLLDHLKRDMPCHRRRPREPGWAWKKRLLEKILNSIYGIDIHPFATFLTLLNLMFHIIDYYAHVRRHYPDFSLKFNIVTYDALAEKPQIFRLKPTANAREKEAIERMKIYARICDTQFDFVVGNPPWGTVLKGKLGPLGDDELRRRYAEQFKGTATGKYDIFVLFIHKGLDWLKPGGRLGMITQIMYVDKNYGRGIRAKIRRDANVLFFIDLQEFGDIIFPGFTNYPAITILERRKKGIKQGKVRVVRVRRA